MKPKIPSKKLIKESAAQLAQESLGYFNPTYRPWELRHKLGKLVRATILRNGPLPRHETPKWPFNRDNIVDSLEASGVAHRTAKRIGALAFAIANNREQYWYGYSIRLGKYLHGKYPTRTPVALIRQLTLEFIADPLSKYAKIPYCSLKQSGTNGTTYDFAIFASPAYGISDYNKVTVKLDTPLAKQAFAIAMKLAEKVYKRAKAKLTA